MVRACLTVTLQDAWVYSSQLWEPSLAAPHQHVGPERVVAKCVNVSSQGLGSGTSPNMNMLFGASGKTCVEVRPIRGLAPRAHCRLSELPWMMPVWHCGGIRKLESWDSMPITSKSVNFQPFPSSEGDQIVRNTSVGAECELSAWPAMSPRLCFLLKELQQL